MFAKIIFGYCPYMEPRIVSGRGWAGMTAALLAAGALLLSSTPASGDSATSAPAAEPKPTASVTAETIFNEPADDGSHDFRIEEKLIELINGTPEGGKIDASIYSFTRPSVAEALRDAQARGAQVRLAIDGGTDNADNKDVTDVLKGADLTKLVFCNGPSSKNTACIGNRSDYGINHNKLMTFSKTGDKSNVVVVSSYNLTNTQGQLFNNGVIMSGDPDLYGFFVQHVENMLAQKRNNDYFNTDSGYYKSADKKVTAYMSPRAASDGGTGREFATDTWAQILKYITEAEDGCTLEVAQASMTNARPYVADQIARIADLGCQVRIVYDSMGDETLGKLSGHKNVEMKRYLDREDSNDGGQDTKVSLHHKYMVFTGNYNGTAGRKIAFSGSHNVTSPALRNNDEILIKVEDGGVADAFRSNFGTLWDRAKCANPLPDEGSCP